MLQDGRSTSSGHTTYKNAKKAEPMRFHEIFTTLMHLFAARAATAAG